MPARRCGGIDACAVGLDVGVCARLPAEGTRSRKRPFAPLAGCLRTVEYRANLPGHLIDIAIGDQDASAAADFGYSSVRERYDGRAARHRLQTRKAKSFVAACREIRGCMLVQRNEV